MEQNELSDHTFHRNCCIFSKRWHAKWRWKRGYFKGSELVLWNDLNSEGPVLWESLFNHA